jgi:cytochrome c553
MRIVLSGLFFLFFFSLQSANSANETPDPAHGRVIYESCASCHLPEGWGMREGSFPQIAGQLYSVILKQLNDIRNGTRNTPDMHPILMDIDAQALADVAAYIAALPMSGNSGVGPGDDLAHGEQIYRQHCTACHGESGEGNQAKAFPLLQNQHYEYMLRQFSAMRSGKRHNPEMAAQIAVLSDRDLRAVLDYVARLRPQSVAPPGWINPDFR